MLAPIPLFILQSRAAKQGLQLLQQERQDHHEQQCGSILFLLYSKEFWSFFFSRITLTTLTIRLFDFPSVRPSVISFLSGLFNYNQPSAFRYAKIANMSGLMIFQRVLTFSLLFYYVMVNNHPKMNALSNLVQKSSIDASDTLRTIPFIITTLRCCFPENMSTFKSKRPHTFYWYWANKSGFVISSFNK